MAIEQTEHEPITQHDPPIELTGPTETPPLLTGPAPATEAPPAGAMPPTAEKKTDSSATPPTAEKKTDSSATPPKGSLWRTWLILAVVLLILLLVGLLPRLHRQPQLKADAKAQKNVTPTVNGVAVQPPPPFDDLSLPGNVQAVQQTAVTARASGYLKQWFVDIGDRVHRGQLLATIATPDLDQSLAQARAQLSQSQAALAQSGANLNQQQANLIQQQAELSRSNATLQGAKTDLARSEAALAQAQEASAQQAAQLTQAQANLNLAKVTAQRYQNLLAAGAIDQQTTDQAVASYQTNLSNVAALAAAVRAGEANTRAFRAAVLSSQANVQAYVDGVRASRAQVGAAAANVRSYRAAVAAAGANVRAASANVARSAALQGFQNVTAPFDGVITARNVDTGALISTSGGPSGGDTSSVGNGSAGSSSQGSAAGGSTVGGGSSPGGSTGGGGTASLFSIAQTGTLRFYVNVPQSYIGVVGVGQNVKVVVQEIPSRTFSGTVARTAGALDAASRTLVAEVRLDNKDGALKPGMFAQAHLRVPHPSGAVFVPGPALVTNAGGTQVIVITPGHKLHFQPISVGRDFGDVIEVLQGLRTGQQVVSNPSDGLHEGQSVQVAPPAKTNAPGGQ